MNVLFCQRLKEARKINGLSQKNIAESLGIADSSYANWERGRTEPNISNLQNLCVALNVSANELLGIEDGSQIRIADFNQNH